MRIYLMISWSMNDHGLKHVRCGMHFGAEQTAVDSEKDQARTKTTPQLTLVIKYQIKSNQSFFFNYLVKILLYII